MEKLAAQSAIEGMRFERWEQGDGVDLVRYDGAKDYGRVSCRVVSDDRVTVVLEATKRERVTLTFLEGGLLQMPRGAELKVYRPIALESATRARTLDAGAPSAWSDLATRDDAYTNAVEYTAANVVGVFPGGVTPEAALTHYLASRVRRDERFREVMSASCDERCTRNLAEHDKWTFTRFQLLSKKGSPERVSVKVQMTVQFGKESNTGTDQFLVVRERGAWRIAAVPR